MPGCKKGKNAAFFPGMYADGKVVRQMCVVWCGFVFFNSDGFQVCMDGDAGT